MSFELTNDQRVYFGLEPIKTEWESVVLKGDTYRADSVLYFHGDVIKRYIVSTEQQYKEVQYDDLTRNRTFLLPKTSKGKEKKLTASVLESRQPIGAYCIIDRQNRIYIGNYNTQTTFYDSRWEQSGEAKSGLLNELVDEFIKTCPSAYLEEINLFKNAKKKNIRFKLGDFFVFKISRTEFGFGRILLNIDHLKKLKLIPKDHGLNLLMTKPVLIKMYSFVSKTKEVNVEDLEKLPCLPSDYMMDNLLLYGQFEIIGNKNLNLTDFDFPMSYGRSLDFSKRSVFLQWGLISIELPLANFDKYLIADNPFVPDNNPSRKITNPYGYYGIGFYPKYSNAIEIKETIKSKGIYNFDNYSNYSTWFDLRNPKNQEIRNAIMTVFGLDPNKEYEENCKLVKSITTVDLLKIANKN